MYELVRGLRPTSIVLAAVWALTPATSPAQQIAYQSVDGGSADIFVVDADGSNPTNLTNDARFNLAPQWSPDGGQIAYMSQLDGNFEIYVINADGSSATNLTNADGSDRTPIWSPDGTQILFVSDRDGDNEIYVMDADGSDPTNLTNDPGIDSSAEWSRDGTQIVFISDRDGDNEIYVMNADGTGLTALTNNDALDTFPQWSPDGTQILFFSNRDGNNEIYVMNADGAGQMNLTNSPASEMGGRWSPGGNQITFHSNRDGNNEIYRANADGSDPRNLTMNAADDLDARWSADGGYIVFRSTRDGDQEIFRMGSEGSNPFNLSDNARIDQSAVLFGNFSEGVPPVISAGGIILANLAPKIEVVSPWSIISVFGSGFTTESVFFPNLDTEGNLDTVLGGVCLEMNGERLPLFAATSTQLNAQASAEQNFGPASFVAISNCDTPAALRSAAVLVETGRGGARNLTSDVEMTVVEGATPAFFLYPPLADDGLIAARFNTGNAAVAPAGMFNDEYGSSRPAQAGEIITLYGTGFGQTEAGLNAGELTAAADPLLAGANVMVTFGGVVMDPADVLYVGATPSATGLLQLVIRVPALAQPGNNEVVLTSYGKSTPVGPVIPVIAAP